MMRKSRITKQRLLTSERNSKLNFDVDYHDFMDMMDNGLSDQEIAQELGVNAKLVKEQGIYIKRDY